MADLEVDKVEKEFPSRAEPLKVLRGVSLRLSAGENLAVVGPSGSGKSTLLHIIGALDSPTAGTVSLNGQNPFSLPEQQLARWRNDNIGFIFQDHHLLPQLSVVENVLLPAVAHGAVSGADRDRAEELVDAVGLGSRRDHRPAELSGGERQRAAVARALLRKPPLVLADEPTGSLDEENAAAVARLLLKLQADGMLIVVTHSGELAGMLGRRATFSGGTLHEPTEKA
ncbi:MAG: ABC transporter ATP-binding protein [Planctomycetales bacterium]|nr:ABC transporter ATP-binding protein [Planctomycetales bacterium]